jgi:hypothetical protein
MLVQVRIGYVKLGQVMSGYDWLRQVDQFRSG